MSSEREYDWDSRFGSLDIFKTPYCWIVGHDWIDDKYPGDDEVCYRCGMWTYANSYFGINPQTLVVAYFILGYSLIFIVDLIYA